MIRRVVTLLVVFVLILATAYFFPWDRINWGRISILPAATITVTGEAKAEQANNIATFQASVSATGEDKQKVTNEVNTKMTALVTAVKNFGIPDADIQTQVVAVNEEPVYEIMIYPPRDTGKKQWRAMNSIQITLRKVDQASALTDLLNKSGATDVYGPNLRADDTTATQADTLAAAINDARAKAQKVANASGRSLGKVINVVEGGASSYPVPYLMEARGGADTKAVPPVEPGTQTVYKTVTVIFELK